MHDTKLPASFYLGKTLDIARELLGAKLVTRIDGVTVKSKIVETEAYLGPADRASHSFAGKKTPRNSPMFNTGGIAYVYLCYGIHYLFNIVTGKQNLPQAVLIRAVEPVDGIEHMLARRKAKTINYSLTSGPGKLSQAHGISLMHNKASLIGRNIWIEEPQEIIPKNQIISGPRIGISYAKEYVDKPWRFGIDSNPWLSKKFD